MYRLFLSFFPSGFQFLIFAPQRFLLPRITQSSLARQSLKSHHLSLLKRLTTSLTFLKETQLESFSVLPRPDPFKESKRYSECQSVAEVLEVVKAGDQGADPDYSSLPLVTLLRCAIADLRKAEERNNLKPTTEEVFRYLECQIPWLVTDEGLEFEASKSCQLRKSFLSCYSLFSKNYGRPSSPASYSSNRQHLHHSQIPQRSKQNLLRKVSGKLFRQNSFPCLHF
jgi:hypothetical protein